MYSSESVFPNFFKAMYDILFPDIFDVFQGMNAKNLYINSFKSAEEFEEKWQSIDTDKSGYVDKSEFLAISKETPKSWDIYSSNGTTIHKEYLIFFSNSEKISNC